MPETREPAAHIAVAFLACELAVLPARVATLESRVGAMAGRAGLDAEAVVALQDLDLIRQTLEDLARLAQAAQDSRPGGPDGDLAELLTLRDMRDRLLQRRPPVAPGPEGAEPFERLGTPRGGR